MKKWKCLVCGYIHTGDEPPEKCPVCGADKSKFVEIVEEETAVVEEEKITEKAQAPEADAQKKDAPRDAIYKKLVELVLKHHIHPISVHTPNGLLPVAVIFMALAIVLGFTIFDFPAFINLVFVLPVMPIVMVTGYIEWQKRYKGARTTIFLTNMACAVVVLVTLVVVVTWRLINPDVAASGSPGRWVFLGIHLIMLGATGIAGHLGGKLVFGRRD